MLQPEAHWEDSFGVPNPGTLAESRNCSAITRARAMTPLNNAKDKSLKASFLFRSRLLPYLVQEGEAQV